MIQFEFDVPVAMRDGTHLFADIYRPAGDGKHPVLLQRPPYDTSELTLLFVMYGKWFEESRQVKILRTDRGGKP